MQAARFVDALRADLEAIAAIGDERTGEAVRRLSHALSASAALRLLDALGEAALELTAQLPSGRVEVRLTGGQEVELAYVEEGGEATATPDEEAAARITLRLPESLKGSVERAAANEGVSVNTWLVRAIARTVAGSAGPGFRGRRPGSRLTGFGQS